MPKLSGPYEIFDIRDGEEIEFRVTRFDLGDVEIHPGYGEAIKVVPALRVHHPAPLQPYHLPYTDITSNRLRVMLLEQLRKPDFKAKLFKVKKHGVAPRALFELTVTP